MLSLVNGRGYLQHIRSARTPEVRIRRKWSRLQVLDVGSDRAFASGAACYYVLASFSSQSRHTQAVAGRHATSA